MFNLEQLEIGGKKEHKAKVQPKSDELEIRSDMDRVFEDVEADANIELISKFILAHTHEMPVGESKRELRIKLEEKFTQTGLFDDAAGNLSNYLRQIVKMTYEKYKAANLGREDKEYISINDLEQFNQDIFTNNLIEQASKIKKFKLEKIGNSARMLEKDYDDKFNQETETAKGISIEDSQEVLEMLASPDIQGLKIENESVNLEGYLNEYYKDFGLTFNFIKKKARHAEWGHLNDWIYNEHSPKNAKILPNDNHQVGIYSQQNGYEKSPEIMHLRVTNKDGEVKEVPIFTSSSDKGFLGTYEDPEDKSIREIINIPLSQAFVLGHGKGFANIYKTLIHEIDHAVLSFKDLYSKQEDKANYSILHSLTEGFAIKADTQFLRNNNMELNAIRRINQLKSGIWDFGEQSFGQDYRYFPAFLLYTLLRTDVKCEEKAIKYPRKKDYEKDDFSKIFYDKFLANLMGRLADMEKKKLFLAQMYQQ